MITIRKAQTDDLDTLMDIFEQGKHIMRESGNLKQWTKGYPETATVLKDIDEGNCYVCQDGQGAVVGLDDIRPYATIHRLASTVGSHGVAAACLEWCYRQMPNLRADTHRDNRILQHILQKHGFSYCGIIYLTNGDERLAYQKIQR